MTEETDEEAFYNSTCFWRQLFKYHYAVWHSWDIPVAAFLTVAAALFIQCVPGKYLSCMAQGSLLPMMGITSAFIFVSLAGVIALAFVEDKDYLIGRYVLDAYSYLLFRFRWNAAVGIATIIAGFFVYLMSYAAFWPYMNFLFMFFYTLLSGGTLFGTLAKHGIYKLSYYTKMEEEETD